MLSMFSMFVVDRWLRPGRFWDLYKHQPGGDHTGVICPWREPRRHRLSPPHHRRDHRSSHLLPWLLRRHQRGPMYACYCKSHVSIFFSCKLPGNASIE